MFTQVLEERDRSVLLYQLVGLFEGRRPHRDQQYVLEETSEASSRERLQREYGNGEALLEERRLQGAQKSVKDTEGVGSG